MNITSPGNVSLECDGFIPMLALSNENPVFGSYEESCDAFAYRANHISEFFWDCAAKGDGKSLVAVASLNKHHYAMFTDFANTKVSLKSFFKMLFNICDNKLTVWDPKAFQYATALPILCRNFDGLCRVANEAGGTAFYYKERTMEELVAWGKQLGVEVRLGDGILAEDKVLPKVNSKLCIVTNGIIEKSRREKPNELLRDFLKNEHGVSMITARKAVYFALRMREISNGKTDVFKENPFTFTYTSTPFGDSARGLHLIVGGFGQGLLRVCSSINIALESRGVAGQWEFSLIPH